MIVRLSLNQLEKLSKEVVTDEYFPSITVKKIHKDLPYIILRFDEFLKIYARVQSIFKVSKNCSKHFPRQKEILQRKNLHSLAIPSERNDRIKSGT